MAFPVGADRWFFIKKFFIPMSAPLIAIDRHRLSTDGQGVTTLVAFHGCPLHCRYCLNPQCLRPEGIWKSVTPEELLEEVIVDNLYFEATSGGVTFGGGEPLLRPDFIVAFFQLMKADERIHTPWRITIETSLNVPAESLQRVLPFVDEFFVDIKDMNPDIYQRYTTASNQRTLHNLTVFADELIPKTIIRLPHIPNYNAPDDVIRSRQQLEAMGYRRFDEFDYVK